MFLDDITKKIAEAAAQIKTELPKNEVNAKSVEGAVVSVMTNEELKGNQHKIDANKNGKIDAHDFKLLRGKKDVKEEIEPLDELNKKTLGSYIKKASHDVATKGAITRQLSNDSKEQKKKEDHVGARKSDERANQVFTKSWKRREGMAKAVDRLTKEELEKVDEAFPTVADARKRAAEKSSSFEKTKISTGTVYSRKYKPEPEETEETPKKKAKTMKEMLNIYKNYGAESLVENLMIEEPSQDEYKKEVEVAQAKSEGKIRNDKQIAKAATQGVKMEEVEIEVLDADEINGVQIDNIDERSLTDDEMKKREEIVKSMKKGIQGFKDRYGDRAKEVIYATATKQAKKD